MPHQIIQQGAEAIIYKINNKVVKDRVPKHYRHPELDKKIIRHRTKSEAKLLDKASKIINCPKPLADPGAGRMIHMPYISGKKLSEYLEKLNHQQISKQIGQALTKLHNQNIIHGDLTTSNMIYVEKNIKKTNITNSKTSQAIQNKSKDNLRDNKFKIYLIDFGLGFHSHKIEDKAVDLHLLKQALEAKHFTIADKCFKTILKHYKPSQHKLIIERIPVIESRGRYKKKH